MTDCQHDGQYVCPGCGSVFDARHVRDTGCEGLREALGRLIDAIETTGLHEHDDDHGGVDLCLPITGIRVVMQDACAAAGHEFIRPPGVPPFCRWCGAALAAPAASPEDEVPDGNRMLMTATVSAVLDRPAKSLATPTTGTAATEPVAPEPER